MSKQSRLRERKIQVTIETLSICVPWVVVLYVIPQLKWDLYTDRNWLLVLLLVVGGLVWWFMLKANWPKRRHKHVSDDRISKIHVAERECNRSILDMTYEVPNTKANIDVISVRR